MITDNDYKWLWIKMDFTIFDRAICYKICRFCSQRKTGISFFLYNKCPLANFQMICNFEILQRFCRCLILHKHCGFKGGPAGGGGACPQAPHFR